MERIVGAAARIGSDSSEQGRVSHAEANFLALHVAARLSQAGALIHSLEQRIAARFRPVGGGYPGEKQDGHGGPDRPAVTLRSGHAAKRIGKAGRNRKNRKHLQQIAERRGILKGMRTVRPEEATAVGAEHLDSFLRSRSEE